MSEVVHYINCSVWFYNSCYHREDGPAVEHSNGDKEWYQNSLRHRADGPAIECKNGHKEWWINGKFIFKINNRHKDNLKCR